MSYPICSDRNHHLCLKPLAKLSLPPPDLVRQEVEEEAEEEVEEEAEVVEEEVVQQEAHKPEEIDPPEDSLDPNHRHSLETDWMSNDS